MKKKVLSVILSTAMIASVLAGCGGGSEAPAADGGSAEAEAPAADGSRQRQRRGRSAGSRFCGRRCGRDYLDVLG